MKRLALALFLLAAPLSAAPVVVCSASTGRVVSYSPSANTPDYAGNTQAIISPAAAPGLVAGAVPLQHWQCVGVAGAWTNVREMTAPEKATLAAEQATANTASIHTNACGAISGQNDEAVVKRGIAQVLLDEINTLRTEVNTLRAENNAVRDAYPIPVTGITRTSNTATVTTKWAHGKTGTFTVTVVGTTLAAYNVTATATVASATTFTYPVAGAPVTPAVGQNIVAFPVGAALSPVSTTLATRTLAQAKTAICSAINAGSVDE